MRFGNSHQLRGNSRLSIRLKHYQVRDVRMFSISFEDVLRILARQHTYEADDSIAHLGNKDRT